MTILSNFVPNSPKLTQMSKSKGRNKIWYIHTEDYYLAVKKEKKKPTDGTHNMNESKKLVGRIKEAIQKWVCTVFHLYFILENVNQ